MKYYTLVIKKVRPEQPLKVDQDLKQSIERFGTRHQSLKDAANAAKEISKSPIVVCIELRMVHERLDSEWRNGRVTKS